MQNKPLVWGLNQTKNADLPIPALSFLSDRIASQWWERDWLPTHVGMFSIQHWAGVVGEFEL